MLFLCAGSPVNLHTTFFSDELLYGDIVMDHMVNLSWIIW